MKKTLALLFALVMLCTMISAAAADEEKTEVEIFISNPWASMSLPSAGDDPYEAFIEEVIPYADFSLTLATDGETELVTRFAGGNAPDLIKFGSSTQLKTLYEEGVLIDDWTPYIDRLEVTMSQMTDLQRAYYTVDGKLIALPGEPADQNWGFLIREDWLEALGLDMPTTPDELMDVLIAFTFDDPDGNGVDDTYGITSAGGGGIGELSNLILLFGDPSFYITEDGTVSHPILDGSYQEYLDFVKEIVDNGVIDPNWYTQGWDERKPSLYAGDYGVCWYPPKALINETSTTGGNDAVVDWWTAMDMCGGKAAALPLLSSTIRSVSAEAASDPDKMDAIIDYIEMLAAPSDNYYTIRFGAGIDNATRTTYDTFEYIYYVNRNESYIGQYACWAWGQVLCNNNLDAIEGNTPEPDAVTIKGNEVNSLLNTFDRVSAAYQLLSPDPDESDEADTYLSEFTINYILGRETDYESFVTQWLELGGDYLLEDAIATFQSYGLID